LPVNFGEAFAKQPAGWTWHLLVSSIAVFERKFHQVLRQ
jgi:hypothetical protein